MEKLHAALTPAVASVLIALLLALSGYGLYESITKGNELVLASTTIATLSAKTAELEQTLRDTTEALEAQMAQNASYEEQLDKLSGTVGKLDKLAKIDTELLAKYSKVYFLNENYIPAKLTQITQSWISNSEDEYIQSQVWPFLKDMLEDARDDNVNLTVVSGYRSFDKQKVLKSGYSVTYGTGSNAFSADQGYSEHQLGTTVDFSTKETGGALDGFDKTEAYAWLTKNAYKYGFTLSYPAGNTFYQYEPWHWRFVGRSLARDLKDDEKHFYDLDQRDINKYLITLFDK